MPSANWGVMCLLNMEFKNTTNNLTANRVILAGVMMFLVMPMLIFFAEILGLELGLSNPKLAIGLIVAGAFGADWVYVKHISKRVEHSETT